MPKTPPNLEEATSDLQEIAVALTNLADMFTQLSIYAKDQQFKLHQSYQTEEFMKNAYVLDQLVQRCSK